MRNQKSELTREKREKNNNTNIYLIFKVMRKSYLMMAAAATIFAACTQTDLVNPVPETEQEIGFDNHVGKSTRAEITDEEALATEGGFVVWGYKTATAGLTWDGTKTITTIFNGVNVYGEDGNWTYANKKYWDKTSTYNFYAVAPFNPTSGTTYSISGAESGLITITGAKSALAADSDDFLIDREGVKDVSGNAPHAKVSFDFNHVMAKVTLQLLSGDINEGDVITVTKLTMSGWNSNNGTFVQNSGYVASTTNHSEWTLTDGTAGTVTFNKDGGYTLNETTAVAVEDSYIMVPQTIAASTLKFTVDFTITYKDADDDPENNVTEEFVGHEGTLATAQTWGTDTHTTYTIKVGPQPIEFDVTSVKGFTTPVTPGELPIE